MRKFYWLGFLVLHFAIPCEIQAQLKVEPDKNNVVSSKLEGQWEPDPDLTQRLGGRDIGRITIKSDPAIAAKIPAKYEKFLKGKQIYLAGVMNFQKKEYPFLLVEHRGNPHVVYFRERGGDPLGDAESFNLMLAIARDSANDLLFIGGDFNNQPFAAYRRMKMEAK